MCAVAVIGVAGCSAQSTSSSTSATSSNAIPNASTSAVTPAPSPTVDPCVDLTPISSDWLAQWEARNDAGEFSIAIIDVVSGCQYVFGAEGQAFPTASTVKFLVAVALLEKVTAGEVELVDVKDDLREMLTVSSNTATNRLWRLVGGPAAVVDIAQRYDLLNTQPGKSWGTTKTTAVDQASLVAQVLVHKPETLSFQTWILLKFLMADVVEAQAWGVGADLPKSWQPLVKNGWYHTVAGDEPPIGKSRINTLGLVQDSYGQARWIWAAYSNTWDTDKQGIAAWNEVSKEIYTQWASR